MKKKFAPALVGFLLLSSFFPFASSAQAQEKRTGPFEEWIVCGIDKDQDGKLSEAEQCGFKDIIVLLSHLMRNMVILSTFLAGAAIAWAGFKMVKAGDNPGAFGDAKKLFGKVVTGYVVILSAWLIVYTITHTFLNNDFILLK